MAGQKIELGPTGRTVADNVKRVRGHRALNYADLSRKLTELGRPISPLAVRRIEEGDRRVDVDDLLALAVALGVPPNSLLLPHEDPFPEPSATAVGDVEFGELWKWADGSRGPIGYEDDGHGRGISRPVLPRESGAPSTAETLERIRALIAEAAAIEAARRGDD
jgi:transcriptional regulator with XRE-family HTH domain